MKLKGVILLSIAVLIVDSVCGKSTVKEGYSSTYSRKGSWSYSSTSSERKRRRTSGAGWDPWIIGIIGCIVISVIIYQAMMKWRRNKKVEALANEVTETENPEPGQIGAVFYTGEL